MRVAVVTNECQRGAIGDLALWPALVDAAGVMLPALARLLDEARALKIPVVHCLAERRADLLGANTNAPLFGVANRSGGLRAGTPAVELVPELGRAPTDLLFPKRTGVGSIGSTGVDAALRNLGVDEIVLAGVSLNVAIPAIAFEAVNLGYRVTIARDAVAGVPDSYAEDVLENSLSLVATLTTVDELIAGWGDGRRA
ncbi:MAG TPA: cysteine hydrolase [Actinomycetota bacterium]|nr:cysteine hydrolase [Actinomycetota bacterium]